MTSVQNESDLVPPRRVVPRLLVEAARRAEAMGIVEPGAVERADAETVRRLGARLKKAGVALSAVDQLHNVEAPTSEELANLLELMIGALESSPVPKFEWIGLARLFAVDDLAALLNVSPSSLKRYQAGERDTPDAVAARLHFLALLVGDLAGSYNDIGIRRWFHRKRTALGDRAPAALLKGDWDPDEEGPQRIRQLGRELTTLSAT